MKIEVAGFEVAGFEVVVFEVAGFEVVGFEVAGFAVAVARTLWRGRGCEKQGAKKKDKSFLI